MFTSKNIIAGLISISVITGSGIATANAAKNHIIENYHNLVLEGDDTKKTHLAGSPWRGHQGKFRNTSYSPRPELLPPIEIDRTYIVYPDGTVEFP